MTTETPETVVDMKAVVTEQESAAEGKRAAALDETLPELTETQEWCCSVGCGPCQAKEIAFPYSTTRDMHTNEILEQRTHRAYVSSCCGEDLMLWDESVGTDGDFVNFSLYPQFGDDAAKGVSGY